METLLPLDSVYPSRAEAIHAVLLAIAAVVQNEIKDGHGTFQVEYEIKRDPMNSNNV